MISASADRALLPRVDNVEDKRRMHWDSGMQRSRQLSRAIPYAGYRLSRLTPWGAAAPCAHCTQPRIGILS